MHKKAVDIRIKIWDNDIESKNTIYDNEIEAAEDVEPSTTISGGSIIIHKEEQSWRIENWKRIFLTSCFIVLDI